MPRSRGFTLIEVVIVLVIVGVMIAMGTKALGALAEGKRIAAQRETFKPIEQALVEYVMVATRLPCPADGSKGPDDAAWGKEQRDGAGDCLNGQQNGVVPWVTLGITEQQAMDVYYGRITYRVAPGLTRTQGMRWRDCDSGGTRVANGAAPNQTCDPGCVYDDPSTCTSTAAILAGRGLEVRSAAGTVLMAPGNNGAAYVLVSHGPNRAGSYGASGATQATIGTVGDGELQNRGTNPLAPFYVDDGINLTDTPAHFDDTLSRPTVLLVAAKAFLSPIVHQRP